MSERKGLWAVALCFCRSNLSSSSQQVLSSRLRSGAHLPQKGSQEFATGRASNGPILNVCAFVLHSSSLAYNMLRQCNTCGEYIYKGKKFNARKETVDGEDYLGIKKFRFYIKWSVSSSMLSILPIDQ